jgi:diacylglycerol kinase family enzyme
MLGSLDEPARAAVPPSNPIAHGVKPDAPLFIVMNAGSGKHDLDDVRVTIETTLTSAGRSISLHEASDPTELESVVRGVVAQAKSHGGIVVAAGGDGTINAVAEATLGSGCPFGVIPLGTFNYFSRAHGIPSDTQAASQMLLASRAFEVQVGLVNDRVFLVNGSIGLYPELLEERGGEATTRPQSLGCRRRCLGDTTSPSSLPADRGRGQRTP